MWGEGGFCPICKIYWGGFCPHQQKRAGGILSGGDFVRIPCKAASIVQYNLGTEFSFETVTFYFYCNRESNHK